MSEMTSFMPTGERGTRSPQHRWYVEHDFWELQPCLIAPVLPGETLERLSLQSRVVTAPIRSRLVGYWLEYFFFYVPFRQMPNAANLVAMFIDPTITLSPTAAAPHRYYDGRGFDYVTQCLQVVTQEWFRREGESWSAFNIRANRPAASLGIDHFADSMVDTTVIPDGGALGANQETDLRAKMVLEYRRALRSLGSDGGPMDYEEILSSYGAYVQKSKERDRPELLRYVREWTYPTNTVEPTTGVPTTACSWGVSDSADKARAFQEPGFVFGVTCVRPKVYLSNQTAAASIMLDRAQTWLPPMMDDSFMEKSLMEFTNAQGPFGRTTTPMTNGYWLDVQDLFNYGDQYLDGLAANGNAIPLPTTAQVIRYADLAMADSLKVAAGSLTQHDGVASLRVKTRTVAAT